MGIENSPTDVEESTEPPLCSSTEGPKPVPAEVIQAPPASNGNISPHAPTLNEKSSLAQEEIHTVLYEDWTEQYKYAHTIAAEDVARKLGVNLQ